MSNDLEALERELTSVPTLKAKRIPANIPPPQTTPNRHNDIDDDMIADEEDILSQARQPDGATNGIKIGLILLVWVLVVLVGVALWYVYKIGVQSGSETAAPVLQPSQQAKIQPSSRDNFSQELNLFIPHVQGICTIRLLSNLIRIKKNM